MAVILNFGSSLVPIAYILKCYKHDTIFNKFLEIKNNTPEPISHLQEMQMYNCI